MSFKVDRRGFMRFAGGGALGTAASGVSLKTISRFNEALAAEEVSVPGGPESWALGVCTQCPAGCGLRVRKIGARAVKVQGNPLHPVSGGRLCPRGNALLQGLFHPDRIRQPLRRVGPRGALESFEPVSWDVALEAVGGALAELRQVGATGAMGLVENGRKGLTVRLGRRLLAAFGSPHLFSTHRAGRSATAALHSCQGVWAAPVYDIQRADYLLSLGSAVLEAWASPVYTQRAYGEFRQGRAGRRGTARTPACAAGSTSSTASPARARSPTNCGRSPA